MQSRIRDVFHTLIRTYSNTEKIRLVLQNMAVGFCVFQFLFCLTLCMLAFILKTNLLVGPVFALLRATFIIERTQTVILYSL